MSDDYIEGHRLKAEEVYRFEFNKLENLVDFQEGENKMGQSIAVIKKIEIEYGSIRKINICKLHTLIYSVENLMLDIYGKHHTWTNYESDECIELNKEPFELLELGENIDIISKASIEDNLEEDRPLNRYHDALNFLREIKAELVNTPMENEEYIRIELFN